nr:carboxypeptidase-like regulatory domain-containing protein [uncultured Carboxylicivirga sp.]
MNKYKLLIVILFHSVINYVSAQINGRIVDAETGEAVSFATISFQHGKSGGISNSFGDFSINAVPSDTITPCSAKFATSSNRKCSFKLLAILKTKSQTSLSESSNMAEWEEVLLRFQYLGIKNQMRIKKLLSDI